MSTAATMLHALWERAQRAPGQVAFTFVTEARTCGDLWRGIVRFASGLARVGVRRGDRVVVALPNGPAFFEAFYGTQLSGATVVPVFPATDRARLETFARLAQSSLVVSDTPAHRLVPAPDGGARFIDGPSVMALAPLTGAPVAPPPAIDPASPALIQFTSGSTTDPRGVMIRHADLVTNVRQMIEGMSITAEDVFVSWLPVHHDMGLVLMTMAPFFSGAALVLLPARLHHVQEWLRAIALHRGTFTAAPDTAYRLALRGVRDPGAFDLSSLRVALNAAEPVRATTIAGFEHAFGLSRVMTAGYGLAEATVGVSMSAPGAPPRVDAGGRVSVGAPFPGIEVRIVERDRVLPSGAVGEIAVRSPANTAGYFGNAAATRRLQWREGFILTGDLGYLDETGHLFFVSRVKDVINHGGRTIYPADVEEALGGIEPLRRVAAVGVDRGDAAGEQLTCFAEVRPGAVQSAQDEVELSAQIVTVIHGRFGLRPGRVLLLEPRTIPLTENGKVQRTRLKEAAESRAPWLFSHIFHPGP